MTVLSKLTQRSLSGFNGLKTSRRLAAAGTPYDSVCLGVPRESLDGEKRVAITPEGVAKLGKLNFTNIQIERNAGALSNFSDEQYKEAGASIVDDIWSTSGFDLKFCGTKFVPNST